MAIIKWSPFDEMEKFFGDLPMILPTRLTNQIVPAVDIYETKETLVAEMPLAGIDPTKIHITIENNILNVSGEVNRKSEVEEKDYYRQEVRYGSFARTIPLPTRVVGEKATASYKDGLLRVAVPKAEPSKSKSIKIEIKNNK